MGLSDIGQAITCKPTCSNCCRQPFYISIIEGLALYRWLAEHGRWTPSFKTKVQEVRDKTLALSLPVWLLSNIACPLLDDAGLCTAYEARPFHCRVTFSIGDPQECHPHSLANDLPILPRTAVVQEFNEQERGLLKRHELRGLLLPLAEAVLVAEEIASGKLKIEAAERRFSKDYLEASHA